MLAGAMELASLAELFCEIQVLQDDHSKLLLLIERERDARREAILETEQAKGTIMESNKHIESLLWYEPNQMTNSLDSRSFKAKSEISVEATRRELAFLEQGKQRLTEGNRADGLRLFAVERKRMSAEKENLQKEAKQVCGMLQQRRYCKWRETVPQVIKPKAGRILLKECKDYTNLQHIANTLHETSFSRLVRTCHTKPKSWCRNVLASEGAWCRRRPQ